MLLFVSCLSIFVLRVGQMHIGQRTTSPPISTFNHLFPLRMVQTLGWYLFSAWWFSEVYVWSAPAIADLGWVKFGRLDMRASLNEKPVYLHSYHIVLAFIQAMVHLYCDFDRISIPASTKDREGTDERTHPVLPVSHRMKKNFPTCVFAALIRSVVIAALFPFLYMIIVRRTAWSISLYFAKLFWNFSRSAAQPPGWFPPLGVLMRSFISGGLLVVCWQTTNLFFSVFIGKEPLKRGQPLTSEAKDPNGSLLNGLKSGKELVKSFAFWELCLISQRSPDRRKAIFSDIDREGGATWSQILDVSVQVIKDISARIEKSKSPPFGAKPSSQNEQPEPVLQTLPRLTEPLKDGGVFAPRPRASTRQQKFQEAISSTAKSYGQSPDWTPRARARARDVFDRASAAVLSPERRQKLLASSGELKKLTAPPPSQPEKLHPLVAKVLRFPLGLPFRQVYAQRLCGIVFGSPYASLCPVVDAIESLTRLLVASLEEDPYGKVQADISTIISLFTDTTIILDGFVRGGLDIHWTDVDFPPSSEPQAQEVARRVPDVELVLETLRRSLAGLLSTFGPYLKQVGISGKDLRLAREAAGMEEQQR